MGILFTILIGILFTITIGILFTIVLGIQFTISKGQNRLRSPTYGLTQVRRYIAELINTTPWGQISFLIISR
ncbi:MAG: hypothetical protein U9R12_00075 [Candidatus Caldatribacteriota bacterium]|nr:hypothetical protein [Candidatus Caldatribacteriota bacterium]